MTGVRLHVADKDRTARFRKWLEDHPTVTLGLIAEYLGRSYKTAEMWKTGRPSEIPDWALRLLEQPTTRSLLETAARQDGRP